MAASRGAAAHERSESPMTTSEEYESYSADCMLASGEAADDERPMAAQLNALGGVQQALLGILVELRTFNSDRSQWYREVLEVLTAAKDSSICDSERPVEDVGLVKCALQRGHDKEHRGSIEGRRFMWP